MSLKNLGRESLIYGFGHVMARFITFLLLPFYTHVFTTEEYGAVSLAYAFIGFALISLQIWNGYCINEIWCSKIKFR